MSATVIDGAARISHKGLSLLRLLMTRCSKMQQHGCRLISAMGVDEGSRKCAAERICSWWAVDWKGVTGLLLPQRLWTHALQ